MDLLARHADLAQRSLDRAHPPGPAADVDVAFAHVRAGEQEGVGVAEVTVILGQPALTAGDAVAAQHDVLATARGGDGLDLVVEHEVVVGAVTVDDGRVEPPRRGVARQFVEQGA